MFNDPILRYSLSFVITIVFPLSLIFILPGLYDIIMVMIGGPCR